MSKHPLLSTPDIVSDLPVMGNKKKRKEKETKNDQPKTEMAPSTALIFDKGGKNIQWRKTISLTSVLGKLVNHL